MIELIIGGARSGKSSLAESRAKSSAMPVTCIVTAEIVDHEMRLRVDHHRQQRPSAWNVIEETIHLAHTLKAHAREGECIIIDCLTLWLTNLLFKGQGFRQAESGLPLDCPLLQQQLKAFLSLLPNLPGEVILVSNEIGMGIIPLGASNRLFMDE